LFTGEIGKIDDVRFIETTLMCNGACGVDDAAYNVALHGTGATGTDVFQSIIFGEDFYGYAVALPVEIRDDGVTDYGREHGLAWYAIWGSAILHTERGITIETA
jgi:N4-gp56 family major capsid protein